MKEVILISIPVDDLQTLIIDCVNVCLKHHQPPQPVPPNLDRLIDKNEAAELWRCSTSTIDNYARKGILTRHYIGASVRFKRSEVLEVVNQLNPK